jgi:hypothetical protein
MTNKITKAVRVSIKNYEWLQDLKFKNRCAGIDEVLDKIKFERKKMKW